MDVLSRAEIFTGVQALELGLVDELISTDEAIQRAAEMAGLSDYEVVELFPLTFESDSDFSLVRYQPPPVDMERLWAPPANLPPGLYYRYIVPPNR
jgi:protease-4